MTTIHAGDYGTDCAECVRDSVPDGQWAIAADGGYLCGDCVTAEASRIAEANYGNYHTDGSPDDEQWRIVGVQPMRRDEQCQHCWTLSSGSR